jgi:hypothetical protein
MESNTCTVTGWRGSGDGTGWSPSRTAIRGGWPRTDTRQVIAETPTELRAIIEAARADARYLAWTYESTRHLTGDQPTACPKGHSYPRNAHHMLDVDTRSLVCSCGGHTVYICHHHTDASECLADHIEPTIHCDCDTTG